MKEPFEQYEGKSLYSMDGSIIFLAKYLEPSPFKGSVDFITIAFNKKSIHHTGRAIEPIETDKMPKPTADIYKRGIIIAAFIKRVHL
jgi:hypothetical protein